MERTLQDALLGVPQPEGHWRAFLPELEGRTALGVCRYPEFKTPGIAGEAAYRVSFPQPTLDR